MPGVARVDASVIVGTALAGLMLLLGLGFGLQQVLVLVRGAGDPAFAERRYHLVRAARRFVGSAVMVAIGVGMALGVWIEPRAGRWERQVWGWSWVAVAGLVGVLLVLGLWDWVALRRYAVRQGVALAVARQLVLSQALRQTRHRPHGPGGNGAAREPDEPPG